VTPAWGVEPQPGRPGKMLRDVLIYTLLLTPLLVIGLCLWLASRRHSETSQERESASD
jgi:hypothetical protein